MTEIIGVGPHAQPWPKGDHYDTGLLAHGDARNVADKYRYWKHEAIVSDLDAHGSPLEIAIENVERDFNMGTIVRSANAFGVRHIHVIGRKQWNKRGAMKTDAYLHVHYYESPNSFAKAMHDAGKQLVAVDIVPGAKAIEELAMTKDTVLIFGQEGPGLSAELLDVADAVVMIPQDGSTRSLNVGVAAGIAMYMWRLQVR